MKSIGICVMAVLAFSLGAASYLITPSGLPIRQAILDDVEFNHSKFKAVPEIKFITIHNTAEPYSAMQERTRVNTRTGSVTSFHFAVDEDEAVQILPDNVHGWHAGDGRRDGNLRSIGIEICRSQFIGADAGRYERAEANAVRLTAYLLRKYHLTVDDLRMHYNWSGKHCPHRILDAGSWESFRQRVAKQLAAETADPVAVERPPLREEAYDKGGINVSGSGEKLSYQTMYGKSFSTVDSLLADLAKEKITVVTISCWTAGYDAARLMTALEQAGITVEACFVPIPDGPNWIRKNLCESIK